MLADVESSLGTYTKRFTAFHLQDTEICSWWPGRPSAGEDVNSLSLQVAGQVEWTLLCQADKRSEL